MPHLHVIMPVKDSIATTRRAIEALIQCPDIELTVYNDFSTEANSLILSDLASQHNFSLYHWADHTDHPSPNYRLTLQHAQQQALSVGAHLVVVESDVMVQPDTLMRMAEEVRPRVALVAAVTVDKQGAINFPYQYARRLHGTTVSTHKRLSFCCTLLSNEWLQAYSFKSLDPQKQWYDVTISHHAIEQGFTNLLMLDNPVLHLPHSSRPWKRLKYTHPLRYYWQKITLHRDRI